MKQKSILICEFDKNIQVIKPSLKEKGYKVYICQSYQEAIDFVIKNVIDLVLLDLNLKDKDGMFLIENIRRFSKKIPIIVVTTRNTIDAKVIALDTGANDYVVIPFNALELMARIRNQFKKDEFEKDDRVFVNANLKINFDSKTIFIDDEEKHFTNYEYKIITILANNINKTIEHQQLISSVWGPNGNDQNSLRVFMAGIRRKLGKDSKGRNFIRTDIGIGYRMLDLND